MMTALGYLVLAFTIASWVICYVRPPFAIVLVVVLYPLKQLLGSYMPIFVTNSAWFNYMIFLSVCIAVISSISRNPGVWRGYWNKSFAVMMFLYAYALFAILYSPSAEWAMDRARDGAPYWIMQMLMLPMVVATVHDIRRILVPLVVIGCIVMLLFYFNPNTSYYTGRLTLNLGYFAGLQDYRGNPLATAQMGGQIAIVAALLLPMRAGWLINGIRLGAMFMGLGIAVAAGSRAQFMLAVLVIVMFWPLARPIRNVKQFFINSFGLAVMGGVVLFTIRFFISQNVQQDARWNPQTQIAVVGDRAIAAWRLIEAWIGNPLAWPFGLGTNAYSYISGERHSYAHNLYIEMAGELGLLGLVLSLLFTLWIYRAGRDLWRFHRDDVADRATIAVLLAVASYNFLLAMKQGTYIGAPEPFYLAAIACRLMVRTSLDIGPAWAPATTDEGTLAATYSECEALPKS